MKLCKDCKHFGASNNWMDLTVKYPGHESVPEWNAKSLEYGECNHGSNLTIIKVDLVTGTETKIRKWGYASFIRRFSSIEAFLQGRVCNKHGKYWEPK